MRYRFSLRLLLAAMLLFSVFCWWFLSPNDATRVQKLRAWIAEHQEDIWAFYDCEFVVQEELTPDTFFYWWIDSYVDVGYRFFAIGTDGSGGQLAVWIRPNQKGPPPLVFFGSEGEREVITDCAWNFPLLLAHARIPVPSGPAWKNTYLHDTDPRDAEYQKRAKESFARYRKAVAARFGKIPSWEELRGDVDELTVEFEAWLERCHQGEGESYGTDEPSKTD